MISDNAKKQINNWIKKYPKGRQQSAVMQALRIMQVENNNMLSPEIIEAVADYLDMPVISVQEIATFYENYNHQSVGKYQIRFCHNISCMLNDSDNLLEYLQKKLYIKIGEVTKDGKFSIKKVECLGACVGAPMVQIGDKYYENLTKEKIDKILESL